MGASKETVATGGGAATPLADEFVNFLRGGLQGNFGGFGGDPVAGAPPGFVEGILNIGRGGDFGGGVAGDRFNAADPRGSTEGIAAILNNILSPGGGTAGASITESINQSISDQAGDLRAGFTARGGTSLGTPGAVGEAVLRSRAAPLATQAVTSLQLQTLLPILRLIAMLSGRGIPQAEESLFVDENPFVKGLGAVAGGAQGAAAVRGAGGG